MDVCDALGLDTSWVRRGTGPDESKLVHSTGLPNRGALIVSEAGLYKLILKSRKPEAKAFEHWVCSVVLPAIRKTGSYIVGEEKLATGEMSLEEMTLRVMSSLQ